MVKVGDRVKFLSDTGVGIVRSVSGNMAQVEVDGFEIPALLSDIVAVALEQENAAVVRIGPDDHTPHKASGGRGSRPAPQEYGKVAIDTSWQDDQVVDVAKLKRDYAATRAALTPDQPRATKVIPIVVPDHLLTEYAALIAFVPSTTERPPEECPLDMYIVNDSSYELFYCVAKYEKGDYLTTIASGIMEADSKLKLAHYTRMELANVMKIKVLLTPFKKTTFTAHPSTDVDLELHPLKFVRENSYVENDFFDERSLIFTL